MEPEVFGYVSVFRLLHYVERLGAGWVHTMAIFSELVMAVIGIMRGIRNWGV